MIDKFKQAFQEEAREILVELEAALLELNENRSDKELVGRAFRALHTIKGSGSMFGFDQLAEFTHNLENAFDEVRNGRLEITPTLINLSLTALDQIKIMLEQPDGVAVKTSEAAAEILAKLGQLTGKQEKHQANSASQATGVAAPPAVAKGATRDWHVSFFWTRTAALRGKSAAATARTKAPGKDYRRRQTWRPFRQSANWIQSSAISVGTCS